MDIYIYIRKYTYVYVCMYIIYIHIYVYICDMDNIHYIQFTHCMDYKLYTLYAL